MDHLSWFGAEWRAFLCGLSWKIFRLDWQVVFLLARFSVSSSPDHAIYVNLCAWFRSQKAKQAASARQQSDTTVVSHYASTSPDAVEPQESIQSSLEKSEDGIWSDGITRKDSWYVAVEKPI